jgi:hypothetical protein
MKILRIDSEQENLRKLERRASDWKPMQGVDRRTELKSDYSGSNRRKQARRKSDNDRRKTV